MHTIQSLAEKSLNRCELHPLDSGYPHTLTLTVWEIICELSDEEFVGKANMALDPAGAPCNGSRAQSLYPNFADSSRIGKFENLEAAQDLMQRVFNAARSIENEAE